MATTWFRTGNFGNNNLNLGNGNVQVGNGNITLALGNGNDMVQAGNGNNDLTLGNGNDNVQVGNGSNVVVTGSGTDVISAGNGNNLIAAGLGQHTVTAGNGRNMWIDGSVALTSPTADSLRKVLNDWPQNGATAANLASIRSRLAVTYNHSHANKISAGNGLDWFWANYAADFINRQEHGCAELGRMADLRRRPGEDSYPDAN